MITLKEISKIANVSTATVSKVLNGKDKNISDLTRQKILNIAKEEGYIPNGIAKSLKMKRTKTIGIIIPDVMNPFFAELARSLEDTAEEMGYTVILCNSDNNKDKEEKYLDILMEKMVDGIIMTASENSFYKVFKHRHIPLVLLDRYTETGKGVGRIIVNNTEGAYKATKYLLETGCRDIAVITSKNSNNPSIERVNGYANAIKEYGLAVDEKKLYFGNYSIESGYEGVLELISRTDIDGIFCCNDLIAIGAIRALKELNINIPKSIRIIGFDDIVISEYVDPPLTTIRQPINKMGEEAIKMLVKIINNETMERVKILETELIIRGSA